MSAFGQVDRDALHTNHAVLNSSVAGSQSAKTTNWRVLAPSEAFTASNDDSGALVYLTVTPLETGDGSGTFTLPAPTQDGVTIHLIVSFDEYSSGNTCTLTVNTTLGSTPTGDDRPLYGQVLFMEEGEHTESRHYYFANTLDLVLFNGYNGADVTFTAIDNRWLFNGCISRNHD